ncbi:hypothetical protein GGI25_000827 [Coemansia spiralis]|uniref:Uncharacterized protein n=2 Tax=Coemansia TaxID=4863 RepID=A0A9W8GBV1_9FUNG|nr:hypothetical protein EDC05_001808 [Coemansia umbellata]KAJ2623563.1 hypothetical protein GGI26_002201 [Coemansia sp. RSA 1358]KAJ2680234.1 hypothetical protein GGI25_000827 [Coemansia spiralis]
MDSALEKNKVLVLGRASVDKDGLIRCIMSPESPGERASAIGSSAESAKIKWSLETRYYKAELEFWVDSTEQLTEPERQYVLDWLETPDSHLQDTTDDECTNTNIPSLNTQTIPIEDSMVQLQEHLSEVVDAIIFIFDPDIPSSFTDILPWARYGRLYQPEILLCVAVSGPISRNSPTEPAVSADDDEVVDEARDKWFAWCISNGWEWVDLTDPEYSIDNIRDSLTSNEWANMAVKQQHNNAFVNWQPTSLPSSPIIALQEAEQSRQHEDRADIRVSVEKTRPSGKKEQEEWDLFENVSRSVDSRRVEALRKMLLSSTGPQLGQPTVGSGRPFTSNEGNLLKEDDGSGDIAPLMAQVRHMREEISKLDPEQARAKAAEIAMAFAKDI